jgi:hypothetical protein
MSKFPVEYNNQDSNAVVDAVNYVLSGPAGLGQNFDGFSGYNTTYITGNFRAPFTTPSISVNSLGAETATTLTVDDTTGINVNDYVTGPGIGAGAQVVSIDTVTMIVALTVTNTASVAGLITFTSSVPAQLYVAPIAISTVTYLSAYVVKVGFATAQTSEPFTLGNPVTIAGNSKSVYNAQYTGAGVIEQNITASPGYPYGFVIIRRTLSIANPGAGTGGTISFANTQQAPTVGTLPPANYWVKTDCQANATITGPTDRVFISAQLDQVISYIATATSDLRITVAINRYKGFVFNDPVNPGIRYTFDQSIAERVYFRGDLSGSGSLNNIETVFATFIDNPPPAFYLYRLEINFRVTNDTGAIQVNQDKVDVRALSAQVVKQ